MLKVSKNKRRIYFFNLIVKVKIRFKIGIRQIFLTYIRHFINNAPSFFDDIIFIIYEVFQNVCIKKDKHRYILKILKKINLIQIDNFLLICYY